MKNCISCGAQLDDSAVFCVLCGTKQEVVVPPPSYQTPIQPSFTPSAATTQSTLSARSILYKHGSSSIFLSAVILYTVSVVTTVFNLFIVFNAVFFAALAEMSGLSANEAFILNSAMSSMKGLLYFILILICIPTVLYCVGLWLFTINCRKNGASTLGLTIIRNVTVALIVLSAMAIVGILILACIMAFVNNSRSSLFATINTTLVFLLVVCGVILVFPLIFNIKVMKSTAKIRLTVKNDAPHTISSFIPAMLIISSAFQVIAILSEFTVTGLIFTGISVAINILFTGCINSYNREIQVIAMRNSIAQPQPPSNGL